MGLFSSKCDNCGSTDHSTSDCPHGIFSSKCAKCGSVDHSTSDCPHGIFSTQCSMCGSTEHSSSDCPHGIFSTKCAKCGSIDHATSDCPHSIFSIKCSICGSKNHSTEDCPQGLYAKNTPPRPKTRTHTSSSSSSSNENGCGTMIAWLVGIGIVVFVVIWLAFNVVLPVALLNSALALTVLALIFKKYKTIFAAFSLVGGTYMLLDIINGWLSSNFVQNVVTNPVWISVFVYINAVAIGLSTWLLMQPIWLKTNKMKVENKKINILYKALIILIVTVSTSVAPVIYHTVKNPFIRKTTIFINNSAPSIQKNGLTDIDGNVYHTVKIGTQVWMVENLKTTKYRNGQAIGTTTPATKDISSESTPKYQWAYDGDESNVAKYGRLYTWYVVVDYRNIAPVGWHVPSDAEWTTLENYLIANGYNYNGTTTGNYIAKSIAATTGWTTSTNTGAVGNDLTINNTSGFAGLPGGCRYLFGTFGDIGGYGYWWSSSENSTSYTWLRFLCYLNSNVYRRNYDKQCGYSVRCVRD